MEHTNPQRTKKILFTLATFAAALALVVVVLGAYTRLVDGGLGCPDWPGCYGHIAVPQSADAISAAEQAYPGTPVEPQKAWSEMIHRYVAGTLGTLIIAISGILLWRRKSLGQNPLFPVAFIGLVLFQAVLGMWTVTMKLLPVVVMGHLLGGLTLLSLLWWVSLNNNPKSAQVLDRINHSAKQLPNLKPWAFLTLLVVAFQIALGGWTSSNYAGIICPDFPTCLGQWLPPMDFKDGFNLFMPLGANFQGGVLETAARTAIQVIHRFGALITTVVVGALALWLMAKGLYRGIATTMLLLLLAQVTLGVLNVVWLLPLTLAVLHNAVAALLLVSVVTLTYFAVKAPGHPARLVV